MQIRRAINFFKFNKGKRLTLKAYIYTAYYRFCVLHIPMAKLEKKMGIRGEESSLVETLEHYSMARAMAHHVNRITDHTPWESKCLVRALALQKLLSEKEISATLYLGVGKENGKMVAHSWLRSGSVYLTGGTGEGYAVVEKFRS